MTDLLDIIFQTPLVTVVGYFLMLSTCILAILFCVALFIQDAALRRRHKARFPKRLRR